MDKNEKAQKYLKAKEIVKPHAFINSKGIRLQDLIGKKVILIDFWTFSCINCLRTLPYLRLWHEKYEKLGLTIIGVHTPEFEFEKQIENVTKAVGHYGIKYPVVLDNDYATWKVYDNHHWPSKYLIDIDGFVVYKHAGEGAYQEIETKLQDLLEERVLKLELDLRIRRDMGKPTGAEKLDFTKRRSPEIYFGALRNIFLGNGKPELVGKQAFTQPKGIKSNILYLTGNWMIDSEYAQNLDKGAKIILRYWAEKVFIVAGSDQGVRVKILLNGQALSARKGRDVDNKSSMIIKDYKMYRLIDDPVMMGESTIEIIVAEPGLRIYTFTFA